MSKFIIFLLMVINMTSCCQNKVVKYTKPIPIQLVDSTVSFVYQDKDDGKWSSFCAGVWVDDKVILTAYHCVMVAEEEVMTTDEKIIAGLTGKMPDPVGAPISYSDSSAFDVISGGSSSHYNGVVIFGDKNHDIALVGINGEMPKHFVSDIVLDSPKLGEEVFVMGHPAGLAFTLTHGYVSGFHSGIESGSLDFEGPFLQINATIVGGNSGGGVFNKNGKLLGIVSFANRRAVGQGFAIPSGSIKKMLEKYNESKNKKK